MSLAASSYLTLFAPLVGCLVIALAGTRLPQRWSGWIASAAILAAFAGALGALSAWSGGDGEGRLLTPYTWLTAGAFEVRFDLFVDPLSIFMMLVVTGVSFLIHVYSIGYMAGDPQERRFFAYLNVFVFAMLLLVMAGNFVLLLIGWGLVGMASYLLIGFWHDRPSAVAAAKKAFVMNAVGDVAIMLALLLVFARTASLTWPGALGAWQGAVDEGSTTALMAALLLLGGAVAKSAQLPLHTWLPDAMEGPTPVSALIHAATMVTAGVYLIARMWPVFDMSEAAQIVVAMVGAVGIVFAGFVALTQTDIKRIIAYSTMSQIAYMFVAVGIGAYSAGLFHLMTHAFFKALLFLGAGIVIHALAGEQDIRQMGGLRKYLPRTYWLFVIASLALAGVIPLSGFFSKDEILAFAFASSELYGAWGWSVWVLALLGVLLTGIYSFRLLFVVFHGPEGAATRAFAEGGVAAHAAPAPTDEHRRVGDEPAATHAHAHTGEAPATMFWPVALLGLLSVVGGWLVIPGLWNVVSGFFGDHPEAPGATATREALHSAEPSVAAIWLLSAVSVALAIAGILIARRIWDRDDVSAVRTRYPAVARASESALGVDALYDRAFFHPAAWVARTTGHTVERRLVEPSMWLVAGAVRHAGSAVGALQSGLVRSYAFGTLAATVVIVLVVLALR